MSASSSSIPPEKAPLLHPPSDVESAPPETWDLTVRFSASLPDLPISIPVSTTANTATLKQQIRALLPSNLTDHRLRLIYAGKALDDAVPLSKSLVRAGISGTATPLPSDQKGKSPIYDPPLLTPTPKIYIHCSIGDVVLSASDLEKEVSLAHTQDENTLSATDTVPQDSSLHHATTTPAPRGFDRLLTAGFSPSEVAALRLQFLSIQSHTHTPNDMPSPTTLRAMEDQWLDNSNTSTGTGDGENAAGVAAAGASTWDDSEAANLDDMLFGTAMGFFWPIGCLVWGTREEGVFSPRRKIAVVIGVLLNLIAGFVRVGG